LRNRSIEPGEKPFFNYNTITKEIGEIPPANEGPAEKAARQQREQLVAWAKLAVANDPSLPDADKQRVLAFRAAYLLAADAQPGEPTEPYAKAMIDLLTADPTRIKPAFDAAQKAWPPAAADKALDFASEAAGIAFVKQLLGPDAQARPTDTVETLLAPKVKEIVAQLATELRDELNYEFELATNPNAVPHRLPKGMTEVGATPPVTSTLQQREAIAKVLFSLTDAIEPVAAWQPATAAPDAASEDLSEGMKKVIRIVGLHQAALELVREAAVLEPMPREYQQRLKAERYQFLLAHGNLEEQVQNAAVATRQELAQVELYKGFIEARQAIVGKPGAQTGRNSDVEAFQKRLADEQKVTQDRLTQLKNIGDALFEIRKQVRDAIRLTQQYEDGIRYLELRRR
jgi:hypothetical protein